MNKIIFPLNVQMHGAAVGDLQTALQLFLDRSLILPNDEAARKELSTVLQRENAEQIYLDATGKLVSLFQKDHQLHPTGNIDEPTAAAINRLFDELNVQGDTPEFVVKGTVRFFDDFPAAGVIVSAFDRDLRSEQALGQSTTDRQGFYQISYSERQFSKAEKGNADLVVKAFAADGSVLAASPVLFNAPVVAEVNVTIPIEVAQPPTLFERVGQAIEPLLEGLKIEELDEDKEHQDITFLTGETGFDKSTLARFVLAHRLVQPGIQADFWFIVLGGSFYQFSENQSLTEQLAVVLDNLPSLDAAALRKAFVRGFNQKEISEAFREKVTGWIEAFLKLIASRSVSGDKPTFVKLALEDANITDATKQETFARLFNEHRAITPELLDALEKDTSFKSEEIADLRTSFQLSDLIRGDFSVVGTIKKAFDVRQPEQIRTLAKRSEEEWVKLVQDGHSAGNITLPFDVQAIVGEENPPQAEIYGKTLERNFREAFPTTAFAGGLERALQNNGAHGLNHAEDLSQFLNSHQDFEILNTPIDAFLNNGVHTEFQEQAKYEAFRLELKAVQRVFKLSPNFAATDALLADNLHSSQQIYRLGKSEFVRRYENQPGFTTESATLAWNRAADTHAAVLTVVADLKSLESEALPLALQNNNQALSNFPNWNNLFKAGDICECESCRSVLSPAAYFADLLMFLKDRMSKKPKPGGGFYSVKDILFDRRSDVGFLELNCENALTPLPYIDVVCEVLEDAVDAKGDNDLELPSFTSMPAGDAAAKAAVAAAFAGQKISLGAGFSLSQVSPADPDRWIAHGDEITYLLKKKAPSLNFFAEILRNTKASADELRSYPQYVNPKAYEQLRAAKYPISLPFDLFAEEVRAAFQKTNLQRWNLMNTLRGTAAPNNPTDGEIAAEYFNISADSTAPFDEKRLILVADATILGQQTIWGETGGTWLVLVGNVRNFLKKTSLEYNELLALLDLKFINPAGDIAVHHLDHSCDTDKKVIQVLNEKKLDRIHRFLRLWRKLKGWRMWELDLVLRHPSIGNGTLNELFLVKLFYFSQLRNRLGGKTTVEQVCALFGNLNTETRFIKLYEKREDALYQSLFLNKRHINPLDPAFQLDSGTGDLPAGETLSDPKHLPVVIAALGIREADLILFKALTKASDGTVYINDDLNLANLSFLWRHAWQSKLLKFKADEWQTILKLFQQDILSFADPKAAWEFLVNLDQLKTAGFSADELNWLLAADRSAKSATKEPDAIRFLAALRKDLQAIQAEFDPGRYSFLSTPQSDIDNLTTLLTSLLQQLNRNEAATQFFVATLRDEATQAKVVPGLPLNFDFPLAISSSIKIQYDAKTSTLRFTGLMTATEQTTLLTDASLANVTGIAAYQEAIKEFFTSPRLALKFFEPVFTAPLVNLPPAVDFKSLADAALALKIAYDEEQRLLRIAGILTSAEKAAIDALSPNVDYRNAVNSLFTQPNIGVFPPEKIWLLDSDLNVPVNDHLAENLALAISKALTYLSKTQSENTVVQQSSVQLGLTEALTRHLLMQYTLLPDTLLNYLTGTFAATNGVIDYASLKITFDGWFWASRTAGILNKWKITLRELETIKLLTGAAKLLDLLKLPLDVNGTIAPIDRFLRTSRLLKLRDTSPENEITLLEVLEKLNKEILAPGTYNAKAFSADVALLSDTWRSDDVEAFTNVLDLAYPADFLLAESWERLRRAFYFLDNLNAGAEITKTFAASSMTVAHAKAIKELLRSKFGSETWLSLSAEIQDVLREQKRDALSAYLLTHPLPDPKPVDAPSGRWENTNDLYAYYLLDVEMCSCQLTSRLVQGSGSVQLFVQRCFMGLEPNIVVNADGDNGDSAWHWWTWMRKYRVWEANRKVFLWPENWIEPELKKDRSPFFKDLENELLQNEINQYSVETAFSNYLEKLDGVAQLEIAGFYQEDDGDNTIIHVFGRTNGAEPHLYYYRCYDYRQWTPWEKVDLDIQGDYLIPAVVNKRLFLFWPVFSEVPDESENNKQISVPNSISGATIKKPVNGDSKIDAPETLKIDIQKAKKKLKLQMAVSDFRHGKWTPKRMSTDFAFSGTSHDIELKKTHYEFFAIDRTITDGTFVLRHSGHSIDNSGSITDRSGDLLGALFGAFDISSCKGIPALKDPTYLMEDFVHVIRPSRPSTGGDKLVRDTVSLKWLEDPKRSDFPQNDFTLENQFSMGGSAPTTKLRGITESLHLSPVLLQTPDLFSITAPWHLSLFDRWLLDANVTSSHAPTYGVGRLMGTWLPFFYKDKARSFFVLPSLRGSIQNREAGADGNIRLYYPEMKNSLRQWEAYFAGQAEAWLDSINLTTLTTAQREQLEQGLHQWFPEVALPPYPDEQLKALWKRALMRFHHLTVGGWALWWFQWRQFHFKTFYHPFVCDFARLLNNPLKGIPALMSRETQLKDSGFSFLRTYQPTPWVVDPMTEALYPHETVDFTPDGAYSSYNWELFFHAPLLIANSLSKNQRFEEARDWYHFIFNPIGVASAMSGGSEMSKYWITKPFFETSDPQYVQQRIDNIMRMLSGDISVAGYSAQAKKDLEDQVLDWRTNPFEPHRIANYRTVAYQKTVVMKYLDNLIAWGDNLFRQDSMESINEATQLYIMAAEILGPRPKKIPPQAKPPLESFNELEEQFDKFSNALVEVENLVPPLSGNGQEGSDQAPLPMLYFCIPQNDKLLGYWDTVADRLYKIRNCMNIEGVVRQLALFEPPIDPGALVKAVAGGVDISAALADLNAPLPLYRFNVLLQKANEVCNDVKALGSALLAALEKKDAEAIGLLRQSQEIRLLEAVKAVKEKQIEEANDNLEGVKKNKELAQIKKQYYESRVFMNTGEIAATALNSLSIASHTAGTIADTLAGVMFLIPDFNIGASGFGGSPHFAAKLPTGDKPANSAARGANGLYNLATIMDKSAGLAATVAGYERRQNDWDFQKNLAAKEIEQIDKSIAASELRISIAEKELENHVIQIENAKATDEFMRSKYSNKELYQWHVGQISGVYFQSYKLAYDLAKRAERGFRFELGLQDRSYIQFGYWDSLKKGLLSGEKLQYDLRRLETAYLEQNRREFELTKHVSLLLLDPLALIKLRETGRCFINLPEEVFDLDFPGHYFRRIKSVSITLPCVVGPYTTISCTLRLLKNSIRINQALTNGYPRNADDQGLPADDERFIENNVPVKAIAASNSQNDSGVFELSFRDERYLPFEGAGAISQWSLELFSDLPSNNPNPGKPDFGIPLRQFDYDTISDAILHIKYTTREDAGPFKNGAITHLREYFNQDGATPSLRLFNLREEFPTQWQRFLNPSNPVNGNIFELEVSPHLFRIMDQGKTLKINTIWLLARCTDAGSYKVVMTPPLPEPPPAGSNTITLAKIDKFGGLHANGEKGTDVSGQSIRIVPTDPSFKWKLKLTRPGGGDLQKDEVIDFVIILGYEWE